MTHIKIKFEDFFVLETSNSKKDIKGNYINQEAPYKSYRHEHSDRKWEELSNNISWIRLNAKFNKIRKESFKEPKLLPALLWDDPQIRFIEKPRYPKYAHETEFIDQMDFGVNLFDINEYESGQILVQWLYIECIFSPKRINGSSFIYEYLKHKRSPNSNFSSQIAKNLEYSFISLCKDFSIEVPKENIPSRFLKGSIFKF